MAKSEEINEAAAAATGFPEDKTAEAIRRIKEKAAEHSTNVQFWCLVDDGEWPEEPGSEEEIELLHIRLFGATRLLYVYRGPGGHGVSKVRTRIETLEGIIQEVALALSGRRTFDLTPVLGEGAAQLTHETQIQ